MIFHNNIEIKNGNFEIKVLLFLFLSLLFSQRLNSQGYIYNLNQNPFDIVEKFDTSKWNTGISSYSTFNNKLFGYPFEYSGDYQFQINTHDNPERSIFKNITAGLSINTLHCFSKKPNTTKFTYSSISVQIIRDYPSPSLKETNTFFLKKKININKTNVSTTIGLRGDITTQSGYYNDLNNQTQETKSELRFSDWPIGFFLKMKIKWASFSIYKSNNEHWPIIKNIKNYNSKESNRFYLPLVYNSMRYSLSGTYSHNSFAIQHYYIRTNYKGEVSNGHINTFGFNFRLNKSEMDFRYSNALDFPTYNNIKRKRIMNIVYRYNMKRISLHISPTFISEVYPIVNLATLLSDKQNFYGVWSMGIQYHWH